MWKMAPGGWAAQGLSGGAMPGSRRWLDAVAVSLHALLLLSLGIAAWLSAPLGPNREPPLFGDRGWSLPVLVLPALGLWAAYTLGRWFMASRRKAAFGVAVAGVMAAAYVCMVLTGIWIRASSAQETLTAAWVPWLVGYFLLFPIALILLPFAAWVTKVVPLGASVIMLLTWWGYESLTIASSLDSVWTTAVAAAGWIWIAADSLRVSRAPRE